MKFILIFAAALTFACTSAQKAAPKDSVKGASATQTGTQTPSGQVSASASSSATPGASPAKSRGRIRPQPKAGASSGGSQTTCVAGDDTRTLETSTTDQGCEVRYTKGGKTNSVASGGSDMKHCEEVSEKIQRNLEGAGFTCK